MNKLKKIIYEFKLRNVKNAIKENAQKIKWTVALNDLNYNQYQLKNLLLISKKSYLENKLTYIKNAS